MKRSVAALVVVALLWSVAGAATRTWTSRNGKFTTEAELLDFKDGNAQLKKADGEVIEVPLAALSEKDRQYVKGRFPGVEEGHFRPGAEYREWKSKDGQFTTLAEFLGYADGKVHLRKMDGEEVFAPAGELSSTDRRWLIGELRRLREEQEADAEAADSEPIEQLDRQTLSMELLRLDLSRGRARGRTSATAEYALRLTQPQHFYMQLGREADSHQADFRRIVRQEPSYNAPVPFRAVAKLGSHEYAFALDAASNKAAGYNQLYFDLNHNGDLTDDQPIPAADVSSLPGSGIAQSQFPRVDVPVEVDGASVDHAFLISAYCQQSASSAHASISLYAAAVREGYIGEGRKRTHLVLVDHNTNGRFDDRVSIRLSGGRVYPSEGDLLLVNPNPRNRLSSDATMGRDRHYVSKTVCIGKHFYQMETSPSGDRLTLTPTEVAMGYATNPSPAYRAVVFSDDYGVLMIGGLKDNKIPLPEGQWKMASYTIDATAFTGGSRTAVTATFGEDHPGVKVDKGETAELPFGAPFKPVVTGYRTAGNKVSLSLAIVGVGGERCTSFYVNGSRPPEPRFMIKTKDGDVVHQGTFEYG